ncbi:Intradiol ring-cleavage dioxygenase [Melampsora americana]|nr:Intradiol ring-cleavage dioxygenase [Melampsora americana]
MRVLRLGISVVCGAVGAIATIDPRLSTDYRPGWTITPQMIQGDDYLKNIYIRSNLIEDPKESGVRLELAVTLLDSVSCAPLENALVEIWSPDPHGIYPEEAADPQDCRNSSSRRGAIETNPEGVARFVTIFPGSQAGRPPHVNALIRTDWFEHNLNRTLDSDASWTVASVGQIFFPDYINSQVLNQSDYQKPLGGPVLNSDDPIFKAQSSVWQAQAGLISTDIKYGIRAQITLSIASNLPTSLKLAPAPYLCSNSDAEKVQSPTSSSSTLSAMTNIKIGFATICFVILILLVCLV